MEEIKCHCSKPPQRKETVFKIFRDPTESLEAQPKVEKSKEQHTEILNLLKGECFKPLEAIIWILENRVKLEVISKEDRNYIHNWIHQFDYEELELLYPYFTVLHHIPPENIHEMKAHISLILKKISSIV